jgi:hypothetical protein
MKDSEFIELLNLYLDHEISADNAARLEAEVQGNPERRRVYLQYCRMQKACTRLAKDFNGQEAGDAKHERKVIAFDPSGRSAWGPGILAAGGLMAAACVALVLVNRSSGPTPPAVAAPTVATMQGTAVPVAAQMETSVIMSQSRNLADYAAIARTVTVPAARRNDLQPVLAIRARALGWDVNPGNQVGASDLPTQLDWISGLKISPLQRVQAEDLRFEARPLDPTKNPTYHSRSRPDLQGVVEMTAFQFQK